VWKTSQADDFSRPENPRFVEQLDLRATGFFLLAIMEAINAAPAISVGTTGSSRLCSQAATPSESMGTDPKGNFDRNLEIIANAPFWGR
jgi:hypothetical protein